MILWLVLLGLVIAISFVLAARSMRDFQEFPASLEDYSLFLIRKPKNLTAQLLTSIQNSLKSGQLLSFERLFKGSSRALVVFGPKELLVDFNSLDLLELEDYTNVNTEAFSASLVGFKNSDKEISVNLPKLEPSEQFWWQVSLSRGFKVQIKAVLLSANAEKRANLDYILQNLAPGSLFMLPKVLSEAQILKSYQKRIFPGNKMFSSGAGEVLQLLFI